MISVSLYYTFYVYCGCKITLLCKQDKCKYNDAEIIMYK